MLARFLILKFMRFALALAIIFSIAYSDAFAAPEQINESSNSGEAGSLKPKRRTERRYIEGTSLTEDTLALARMLNIHQTIEDLKKVVNQTGSNPGQESLVRIMYLRQNCQRAIQFASLELEEALANIEGDLTYTELEYSLFSAKQERSVMLNNAATFLTSGTLGVLDSASGLKYAAPVPNIFGITGNAAAVAIPLWGLRPRKYKSLQAGNAGNMLAPIFDLPYTGVGYDPLIWKYLNTVALDEKDTLTRRQALLARWRKFRSLSVGKTKNEIEIKQLAGFLESGEKVSLDLLKTRAELLVELRTEVQSLYADLSDLNTEIMKY